MGLFSERNRGSTERGPPLLPQFTIIRSGKAQWNNNKNNTTTRKLMFVHAFISSFANEGEFCSEFHSTPLRSFALPRSQTSIVLLLCSILLCLVAWYVANHSFCCSYCFCRSCVLGAVVRHPSWISVCLFVFFRFFFFSFFSGEWEWRRNEAAASTSTSSSSFNYPLICSVPSFILWWIVLRFTSSFHFLCLRRRI